ncbi:MAG: type II secretion system protein [Candidatus Gracilibacteria bacterium]
MFIKRRAYTLVELIITLTIFAIVAVLCVSALVTSMASAKRIQAQVFLYSEAQSLMDQLARKVERSAVDYEAYYLRYGYHSPETGWETLLYGYYGQSFYHPGDDGWYPGPYGTNVGNLYGVECADLISIHPDDCPTETPNSNNSDSNTFAHPFTEIYDFSAYPYDDPTYMNAFCESDDGSTDCEDWSETVMNELILINGAGDERTIFVQEPNSTSGEYAVSMMRMTGTDTDSDGLVDTWICDTDFNCTDTNGDGDPIPNATDLSNSDDPSDIDFMPIVPSALSIERFTIYIAPFEDPYRAIAEEDVQIQPQVTIVFTATLSDRFSNFLLGDVPTVTVQRTVSTGVYSEITSYE